MRNLLKKDNSTSALIAYVALGAISAGAITYLYLKKRAALKAAAKEGKEHATDYLKPHHLKKKRTTDLHDLAKIAGIDS